MIDARIEGRAGRITLSSPATLNALTVEGVSQISAALDAWEAGDTPDVIVIDGAGPKAFCAGGDIVAIHRAVTAGQVEQAGQFWAEEYRLNARLAAFPIPIVSFLHGHTLGGGVGLGCHVRHRVVGESVRIAMPECAIGFVPDVGGTHLLAQAPDRLGEFLAITGARMGPGDAIQCGFADRFVPQDRWPAAIEALVRTGDPATLDAVTEPSPESPLAARRDIDAACALDTPPEIAAALPEDDAARLRAHCPLSVWASLALVRAARAEPGLEAALAREHRAAVAIARTPDLAEGIRAMVIDKDRSPRWQHSLDTVPPAALRPLLEDPQ